MVAPFVARKIATLIAFPLANLVVSGVTKITPMKNLSPSEVATQNKAIALSIARTIGSGIETQAKKFIRHVEREDPFFSDAARLVSNVRSGFGEFGASGRRGTRQTIEGIRSFLLEAKPAEKGLFEP